MPDENLEKRLRDTQAALTAANQKLRAWEPVIEDYNKVYDEFRSNPQFIEAIQSVRDGEWGQTTSSRPAVFSQPRDEEPEYVKTIREELSALKERVEGVSQMTEAEQIAAARREIDAAESAFRKANPTIPEDVYGKINQRIADTGLSFDDCARLEAFDYLKGTAPPAAPAAPAPTTFEPVGGQPPPTGQSPTPTTAEEVARQAETRFKAKLGIT